MTKNTVRVGVVWQVWGKTEEIELPPSIDPKAPGAREKILDYIDEVFRDIPLPVDGDYVENSDVVDELSPIDVAMYGDGDDELTAKRFEV